MLIEVFLTYNIRKICEFTWNCHSVLLKGIFHLIKKLKSKKIRFRFHILHCVRLAPPRTKCQTFSESSQPVALCQRLTVPPLRTSLLTAKNHANPGTFRCRSEAAVTGLFICQWRLLRLHMTLRCYCRIFGVTQQLTSAKNVGLRTVSGFPSAPQPEQFNTITFD